MNREKFENINKKFIQRKKIILSDYVINSGIGKNILSKNKENNKKACVKLF